LRRPAEQSEAIPNGLASTILPTYGVEIIHHEAHEAHEEFQDKSVEFVFLYLLMKSQKMLFLRVLRELRGLFHYDCFKNSYPFIHI